MLARLDAAHVGEGRDQPDGAVTAHAQVSHVVEEDHAGGAARVHRFTQQSADHHVGTPRLIYHCGTEIVVFGAESFQPGAQRAVAQIRAAADDQPRGLASGMRIDHPNLAGTAVGHG